MAQDTDLMATAGEGLKGFFDMQGDAMREMLGAKAFDSLLGAGMKWGMDPAELAEWASTATQLQQLWFDFATHQAQAAAEKAVKGSMGGSNRLDPAQWLVMSQSMLGQMPKGMFEASAKLAQDQMQLWSGVMQSFAAGATGGKMAEAPEAAALPKSDRRFADAAWREHPAFLLLHQTYLMLADYFRQAVKGMDGLDRAKRQQLEFAVSALAEAMSPDNFLALNPVVMKRTIESRGANLVRGMQHLINDMRRGQLTHTDPNAFRLGENLAATPGKVVHETPIFQLIQYSPTTDTVLEVPLIIFPPWINRFYILDLTPKKSFIKWAVDQGITVFVVSWKSADETMGDVVWDDYIRAQMEAIDHVRARLDVPAVHTIGYCVAGTTLAATLAILSRRGEADKVKSATFFTAQVDFEKSGDLKNFIDDGQLEMIGQLSPHGYLDGRYLAAAFNALRGRDLIWNYVVNNYMMGEDYPAFDLLHWNGDVTNLPSKWHNAYLRDLYRDNKLVVPDALEADGTPIDLTKVATPSFVQAGREDHIAPAESVWRITKHFTGPMEFLLAGSGHIAGVVNPPAAGKYQYWVGDSAAPSLKAFVESATEHPGSWWPHWLEWLHRQSDARVPASGKRVPGSKGDTVIEDAPGRYVKTR
ncbi:polyhydroxyalkanoate synthase [Erythromicrobium ramosum]|uniref:Class I poly(R)-hydroxyalkanoic acid synthase n=1 Tax=Erythrobacter ramosus TaxID=35811 RepID=A0A6I4UKJ2_9SPHN|nr:class I poly(R)-hydroxyalkanoic acid synthase [Erythrobacter ramosus]MBB3774235.1 polyhydroxyalkanoate synthase [Erythrobacter ramosus]MXP38107.1 class I poly(R)-hydroxyalkanoic acid synthase [Erythrobacter ramosus]